MPRAFCRLRADLAGIERRNRDAAHIQMMVDAHRSRAAQRGRQCRVTQVKHLREDFVMALIESVRMRAWRIALATALADSIQA